MHPPPLKDCSFKNDGLKITTEIADEFMLEKFQQVVQQQGIKDETPFKRENLGKNSSENVVFRTNEEIIKRRLSKGRINIYEYDEIKKRIN